MHNPLALSLWVGILLYAAVTIFGVVIFHGAVPNTRALTDGYGVAYNKIATSIQEP